MSMRPYPLTWHQGALRQICTAESWAGRRRRPRPNHGPRAMEEHSLPQPSGRHLARGVTAGQGGGGGCRQGAKHSPAPLRNDGGIADPPRRQRASQSMLRGGRGQ
eukprot:13304584-Alexandrium_andersonii.AAC.1